MTNSENTPDISPDISIVFRALNEEKFFEMALQACKTQALDNGLSFEIVLVDSGSTDRTLEIAKQYDCKIVHIPKKKFSFGRSLNWGCEAAKGQYLVFISAHCIPTNGAWLQNLVNPLLKKQAAYSYGGQVGNEYNKFSEKQLFGKYFPPYDKLQDKDFFVNNANSALRRDVWERNKFDEKVTGLEDMVLGKQIIESGEKIAYIADAAVIHIHEESYGQVRHRYYREALTLRSVLPDVRISFWDFLRYTTAGIFSDFAAAIDQKVFFKNLISIIRFRTMQFWGSYKGQNENRKLSRKEKEKYYYPKINKRHARHTHYETAQPQSSSEP